jgi:hypothetical protein
MTMHLAQAGWNLFIAGFLGAAIGLERQWRQHLAGLNQYAGGARSRDLHYLFPHRLG